MVGIISTLRECWQLALEIAASLGIPANYINGAAALFFIGVVLVLVIHQLPRLLNSLTTIGNNNLRKKEQALESKFIDEDIKYLIRESQQVSQLSKLTGLKSKSLFELSTYVRILKYSQGEINQTQLKKATPYLVIKDRELLVKLTKFDIVIKYVSGLFWWVLVVVGIFAFLGCFISLMLTNFLQPLDAKAMANLAFYPLMSIATFIMGFAYLKMYLEIDAAEKIQDFMNRNPNWNK